MLRDSDSLTWLEEGLRALKMDRLELVGIKTEQLQDCWGDLRRLHRRRDSRPAGCAAPYHRDGTFLSSR